MPLLASSELVGEALGHRLLAALRGRADRASGRRGCWPGALDLDRHLVGGATDATALDLERRLDVLDGPLERGDRLGAGLLLDGGERLVDDLLGVERLPCSRTLLMIRVTSTDP